MQPQWRSVLQKASNPPTKYKIADATQERTEQQKNIVEQVRLKLAALRKRLGVAHHVGVTDKPGIAQSKSSMTPADVRAIINKAYESIEKQMLETIPRPKIAKHRKTNLLGWPECTRLLQVIKKLHKEKKNCKDVITGLNKRWITAFKRLMEDTKGHHVRRVCCDRNAPLRLSGDLDNQYRIQ